MNADPEVRRYLGPLLTPGQAEAWVLNFQDDLDRTLRLLEAVEVSASGEFISFTGLGILDEATPVRRQRRAGLAPGPGGLGPRLRHRGGAGRDGIRLRPPGPAGDRRRHHGREPALAGGDGSGSGSRAIRPGTSRTRTSRRARYAGMWCTENYGTLKTDGRRCSRPPMVLPAVHDPGSPDTVERAVRESSGTGLPGACPAASAWHAGSTRNAGQWVSARSKSCTLSYARSAPESSSCSWAFVTEIMVQDERCTTDDMSLSDSPVIG